MATVPQARLRGAGAPWLTGVVVLATLAAGCVTTEDDHTCSQAPKPPPPGSPWQIAATWQNHMVYAPDPTKGGAPGAGLVGRLYLFGQKVGTPVTAEGTFAVAIYDEAHPEAMPQAWSFEGDSLQQLCRQDVIGWGYTVFLPWPTWTAAINKVRVRCCFLPSKAPPGVEKPSPLYCETRLTLAAENGVDLAPQGQQTGPGLQPTIPQGTLPASPAAPPGGRLPMPALIPQGQKAK